MLLALLHTMQHGFNLLSFPRGENWGPSWCAESGLEFGPLTPSPSLFWLLVSKLLGVAKAIGGVGVGGETSKAFPSKRGFPFLSLFFFFSCLLDPTKLLDLLVSLLWALLWVTMSHEDNWGRQFTEKFYHCNLPKAKRSGHTRDYLMDAEKGLFSMES